jgi:hypothetical protein
LRGGETAALLQERGGEDVLHHQVLFVLLMDAVRRAINI